MVAAKAIDLFGDGLRSNNIAIITMLVMIKARTAAMSEPDNKR